MRQRSFAYQGVKNSIFFGKLYIRTLWMAPNIDNTSSNNYFANIQTEKLVRFDSKLQKKISKKVNFRKSRDLNFHKFFSDANRCGTSRRN